MKVKLTTREYVMKATLAVGARGGDGDPGPQGIQGTQGLQGLKGDKGDPGLSGASNWSEIQDKPATFPPSSHTHDDLYHPKATADAVVLAGVGVPLTDNVGIVTMLPTRGLVLARDGYGTMLPLLGNKLVLLRADGVTRQDIDAELVHYA